VVSRKAAVTRGSAICRSRAERACCSGSPGCRPGPAPCRTP
jgi:hypothetical protein